MGVSAVPVLRYNAAKASSGSQSDDQQASTSRSLTLCCLRSSMQRRHDTMQLVCMLGSSSMPSRQSKNAAVPLSGGMGPHLTQCGMGQGLPP